MPARDERRVASLRLAPCSGRSKLRGFTLVELLITVAMIGILTTIGIVGYLKYVYAAQSSEAKAVIQAIRGGEENFKGEMLVYLNVSASLVDYYPNTSPNDSRWNWIQPGDSRYTAPVTACSHSMCGGWSLLNVSTAGPVRFGYAVISGVGGTLTAPPSFTTAPAMPTLAAGVPWYVIQATNKHSPASTQFAVLAAASTSGEVLVQNEQY